MSVRVSNMAIVDLELPGAGAILARVRDDDVYIWPAGLGQGPVIAMTRADWGRICREVMLAMARADREGTDENTQV